MWNVDSTAPDRLYQIDPVTGTVIRWIAAPEANPTAIVWDGLNLWVTGTTGGDIIYQIDPITGTVKRTATLVLAGVFNGVAWDGRTLWASSINQPVRQISVN